MKILIIEAEKPLQDVLIKFFTSHHYEIVCYDNGVEAIEFIKNSTDKIDIIISDLDEPTKQGLEFLFFLQQAKINIPFIFISLPATVHSAAQKLQRGSWNYLQKPLLNLSTLLITIEQLCHNQQLLTASELYREQIQKEYNDLEEDQLSGYKLQQQLLPKNNQDIFDLNFNYFLHPSLYISGDFIDYQQLTDRYVIFYLSDVSGHGVGSAFVTVLLKACIAQYCSEFTYMSNNTAIEPKEMLNTLNKVVCRENLGKYLTMVYMVYDKKLSKLFYSVAGHYPFPVLIDNKKVAKFIGERGYPVGMFNDATYQTYELDLPENFKIAIFSDGIMELRTEPTLAAKEQKLLDILTDQHDNPIDIIKNRLAINLEANLPDDVTGLFIAKGQI